MFEVEVQSPKLKDPCLITWNEVLKGDDEALELLADMAEEAGEFDPDGEPYLFNRFVRISEYNAWRLIRRFFGPVRLTAWSYSFRQKVYGIPEPTWPESSPPMDPLRLRGMRLFYERYTREERDIARTVWWRLWKGAPPFSLDYNGTDEERFCSLGQDGRGRSIVKYMDEVDRCAYFVLDGGLADYKDGDEDGKGFTCLEKAVVAYCDWLEH
jgi:hypothetical protein